MQIMEGGKDSKLLIMRIAINLLYVRPREIGGAETFISNLVNSLTETDKVNTYVLCVTKMNKHVFLFDRHNVEYLEVDLGNYAQIKRMFYEQFILPFKIRKNKIDLLLNMGNTGIIYSPCKTILTIHDLLYITVPREYSLIKRIYLGCLVKLSCSRAAKIAAVSENTKNDIIRFMRIDKNKIKVVYEGVNYKRFSSVDRDAAGEMMRNKYGINGPYIYMPASLHPRKNIDLAIKAFATIKTKKQLPHKLVITGGDPQKKKKRLDGLIEINGMGGEVHYLGVVPDSHVPNIYKAAELMIYLSSYEGFGLPILEAMAAGCPILSSNRASLPEVVGEAGLMVDPLNTAEIASNMYKMLTDVELRRAYIEKGINQSQLFSWEKVANAYMEIFKGINAR